MRDDALLGECRLRRHTKPKKSKKKRNIYFCVFSSMTNHVFSSTRVVKSRRLDHHIFSSTQVVKSS